MNVARGLRTPFWLLVLAACGSCFAQAPQSPSSEGPLGFGRAATGACDGAECECYVTRADDPEQPPPGTLRACAEAGNKHVLFTMRGPIVLARALRVASNTTLDGRKLTVTDGPVTISGQARQLLLLQDVRNVIVRDLFFTVISPLRNRPCENLERPVDTRSCGVAIDIVDNGEDVWIDHNDFGRCGKGCVRVWTFGWRRAGGRAMGPDRITLSNNRFHDSFYAVTIGSSAMLSAGELPAHLRVTLYQNYFSRVRRRSPRAASFAQVHVFNNLMSAWGRPGAPCRAGPNFSFAASSVGEAQLLLENNVFEAAPGAASCRLAAQIGERISERGYSRGLGYVRASGNLLLNGAELQENQPGRVFNPADSNQGETYYPYRLLPARGLADVIRREAGPRGFPSAL